MVATKWLPSNTDINKGVCRVFYNSFERGSTNQNQGLELSVLFYLFIYFCVNKAPTLLHKIGLLDVLNDMDYLMSYHSGP